MPLFATESFGGILDVKIASGESELPGLDGGETF
jgi:hypothetical protein